MIDYTQGSGKEYHIGVSSDQIGDYVILTGDPGRVEYIASFLVDAHFVGKNREFVTYTGMLNGVLVSVCSTGIGGPSTAIAIEELVHLGAHTFLRLGTCGGISVDVCGGDIVIATSAIRQDGTTKEYAPIEVPAVPAFEVLASQVRACKKLGLSFHTGMVQSKDSFYGQHMPSTMPTEKTLTSLWEAYVRLGVLASEMEASTLFIVGQARHVRTGAMFLCIANQEREKLGLANDQVHNVTSLIKAGIETIKQLIENEKTV